MKQQLFAYMGKGQWILLYNIRRKRTIIFISAYTIFKYGLIFGRDFQPADRIVVDKLWNLYFFIYYIIKARNSGLNDSKPFAYYFVSIIGFTLIIVVNVIYNEIIVLKFWNLDRDTKSEIESRNSVEHDSLMKDMVQFRKVLKKVWMFSKEKEHIPINTNLKRLVK